MTNREAFNICKTHLLKQMKRSEVPYKSVTLCLYRGPNGLMCGLGPLIPDEKYHPGLENMPPALLIKNGVLPANLSIWMLETIQRIHDTKPIEEWEQELNILERYIEDDEIQEPDLLSGDPE